MVKQLEQGPPVESPIQIRLIGDDLDVLRAKADEVAKAVRDAGGYKVHDDLGRRMPVVQIDIDQERANTLGIRNSQVGPIAQSAFAGAVHIFGLLFATSLTLVALPVLYYIFCAKLRWIR